MSQANKPALIIAGMHRSGTSMISSYLNAVGVVMGDRFLEKDTHNPKGYFEDEEMLHFQQRLMSALCKGGVKGWPDWGFTEDRKWNSDVLDAFKDEAKTLIEKRRSLGNLWGWKDPRSTLVLEFWAELIPEARFLLLYRNPWEVKRSIKKLKAEVFRSHPNYAFEIWEHYNQNMLEFYSKYSERCLLVSANAFLTEPLHLVRIINSKFSWNLDTSAAANYDFYSGDLFYAEVCREELNDFRSDSAVVETLNTLNRAADWQGDAVITEISETPIVSVVIPCYNQGHFIDEALFSVEKSRNRLYEIIIVDDGSNDIESVRRLLALEKEGYHVIRQRNMGLAQARNAGIRAAKGRYILPLDADNKIDPLYITEAISVLDKQPEVGVVYSNCRLFGTESGMRVVQDFDIVDLLCQNYIDACAVIRKSALDQTGGFEENMPLLGLEDWELWIHIHKNGWKFHHLNKFLFDYRVSGNSMSLNINKPENRIKNIDYFFNKHRSLVDKHSSPVISQLIKKYAELEQLSWDRQAVIENLNGEIIRRDEAEHANVLMRRFKYVYSLVSALKKKMTAKFYRFKEIIRKAKNELKPAASNSENESVSFYRVARFLVSAKGRKRIKSLVKKIIKLFVKMLTGRSIGNQDYGVWLKRNQIGRSEYKIYRKIQNDWRYRPLISVVVPVYDPKLKYLRIAIESVQAQLYDNWELCVVDDHSKSDAVRDLILSFAKDDKRIKHHFRAVNGHISACSNDALKLATGDFVAFLDHDDKLSIDALYHIVDELNRDSSLDMIYSDEDKVDEKGNFREPYFKPDWSPDSFLSRNYVNHLTVLRKSIVDKVGGFREGFEGSQDFDLLLRFTEHTSNIHHIPKVLYHWRMHDQSAALLEQSKPYAFDAGEKALADAFSRRKVGGRAKLINGLPGYYNIRYSIVDPGMVSIVIPSKDQARVLKVCIESILRKSTWSNYEIILISNNSTEPDFFQLVDEYKELLGEKFQYFEFNKPFNYSALINFGVSKAKGDYIVLLNNDTEILSDDWMEAMLEQAQRKSIGAVGAKLLYHNDTIQHAGVVIGLGGVAGHTFIGKGKDEPGYYYYVKAINNYSSVTAACLMCRKSVFEKVGGFDEGLAVEYNDVDFCLKLVEHNYYNVYLPHVVLYHYESLTRGHPHKDKEAFDRHVREIGYFKGKWQHFIDHDPNYNPNLSKDFTDFRIAL